MQRTLCVFFELVGQSKVATLASGEITEARHGSAEAPCPSLSPSKLLYVADKDNKCNYLIDTGAAVSVLAKSCAKRTSDAAYLPLVAANILLLIPTVIVDASSTLVLNEITLGHS